MADGDFHVSCQLFGERGGRLASLVARSEQRIERMEKVMVIMQVGSVPASVILDAILRDSMVDEGNGVDDCVGVGMGDVGEINGTPSTYNFASRRYDSRRYEVTSSGFGGSDAGRGNPSQTGAHTVDSGGQSGVNVQRQTGDVVEIHRSVPMANVSLRPESPSQSGPKSNRSDGGPRDQCPAPSLREAMLTPYEVEILRGGDGKCRGVVVDGRYYTDVRQSGIW